MYLSAICLLEGTAKSDYTLVTKFVVANGNLLDVLLAVSKALG